MDTQAWQRLARELAKRRASLRPEWADRTTFARDKGLSYRSLSDLETGRRDNYKLSWLTQVEAAYEWEAGSIQLVLAGGDPVLPEDNTPPRVPAGSRPPIEAAREPDVRMRDVQPLHPGELLEGWRHPDGEWHWLFVAVVDGRPVTVRVTAEAGEVPEEVVTRMRKEVDRHR